MLFQKQPWLGQSLKKRAIQRGRVISREEWTRRRLTLTSAVPLATKDCLTGTCSRPHPAFKPQGLLLVFFRPGHFPRECLWVLFPKYLFLNTTLLRQERLNHNGVIYTDTQCVIRSFRVGSKGTDASKHPGVSAQDSVQQLG